MTLTELAERIERAGADEQRELLLEAFIAIYGLKPPRVHGGSKELDQWFKLYKPFFRKLDAEAYLDAAMMLVPEGVDGKPMAMNLYSFERGNGLSRWNKVTLMDQLAGGYAPSGEATTPALALTAASLRARSEHDR